ncbi:MAG: hypothetical protein WAN43_05565, partial [Rhodomicrobium sp.]
MALRRREYRLAGLVVLERRAGQLAGIRCGGITFKIGFFRARVWAEAGTEDERLCKVTGIGTVSYGR